LICGICLGLSCSSNKTSISQNKEKITSDTIKIANSELEYEVIIIDAGFSQWYNTYAPPRGFHSQNYMEMRNRFWVNEWNLRANNPMSYGDLYEMPINYDSTINYGYEVNFMLYNYLVYFQLTNKVQLGGFVPRIN